MKVSVITVNYNNAYGLKKTIESVESLDYSDLEHVIIDGASNDGSLKLIHDYAARNSNIMYVSEIDHGVFNAMNKGISLATGHWLIFMNSGDVFASPKVIVEVRLDGLEDFALVYGNKKADSISQKPVNEDLLDVGIIHACHQSMFFNAKLIERERLFYDERYQVYSDYELVNRLRLLSLPFKYVDKDICITEPGGIGQTAVALKRKEKFIIVIRQGGLIRMLKAICYSVFVHVWKKNV